MQQQGEGLRTQVVVQAGSPAPSGVRPSTLNGMGIPSDSVALCKNRGPGEDWNAGEGSGMDSNDEAKKREAEADKAKLVLELRIEREKRKRDLEREAARDWAKFEDRHK